MSDILGANVTGHVTIKDVSTGDVIVDKKNAIHFGNISTALARSFVGKDTSFISYMAFGNGAVTIEQDGNITYKQPRTLTSLSAKEPAASLYNTTFIYEFDSSKVVAGGGVGNYEEIECVATIDSSILTNMETNDQTPNVATDFVFDEIAIYTGARGQGHISASNDISAFINGISDESSLMTTHVIFHPVQAAKNRTLEITYKIRIQMGN